MTRASPPNPGPGIDQRNPPGCRTAARCPREGSASRPAPPRRGRYAEKRRRSARDPPQRPKDSTGAWMLSQSKHRRARQARSSRRGASLPARFCFNLKTDLRLWQGAAVFRSGTGKSMRRPRGPRPKKLRQREPLPRRWAIAVAVAMSLISCSRGVRPPCDNPPPFYISLQASDRLNPDDLGRSLTTQVQVLQLVGIGRLEKAGFEDLWHRAKEGLGEDLVQMSEKFVDPGDNVTFGERRDPKANFVAVVALFRKWSGNSWRSVARLPIPPPEKCTPQPADVKPAPSAGDAQLKFVLDG